MTWGTTCPVCGMIGCGWSEGLICEGLVDPDRVRRHEQQINWIIAALLAFCLGAAVGYAVLAMVSAT